jgi:nicotinamidase/pyrazinamidase
MNHNQALVIVDEQRGFMPAEEGERLDAPGFGELTVPNGQRVVYPTNRMTEIFLDHNLPVATTQDAHPVETAHFSDDPNFVDTWPTHCVAGTPGAELHPRLMVAANPRVAHFIKGDGAAATPAEDDSYSGALAHRRLETERELLPDYLRKLNVVTAYVCGLTVGKEQPLCVDSTALDLKALGFDVAVVTDAVEAVVPTDKEICMRNLGQKGIRLVNSHEVVAEIAAIPEVVR